MKDLKDIYPQAPSVLVKDVKINSKEVTPGDIFVCTMGVTADRHEFISDAVKNGASALIVSRDVDTFGVPFVKVENTNKELFRIVNEVYGYPCDDLFMIGVTGTNGKTGVAETVRHLLGDECGYIGTNGKKYKNVFEPIRNTCPDVDRAFKYYREFINAGCNTCVQELSSEAMFYHRLDNTEFDVCILTNITEDHLNTHKTIENYVDCKAKIMSLVKKSGYSVVFSGTDHFEAIKEKAGGKLLTYGFQETDDLFITEILPGDEASFSFLYNGVSYEVHTKLHGSFNTLNTAAAILACSLRGASIPELIKRAETQSPAPGRYEVLNFGQDYKIVLDYAHTEDAFIKVLDDMRKNCKGKIITVTGCAGGREHEKRPKIGKLVLRKSDFVVFTADDPRTEDVDTIICDMLSDSSEYSNYCIVKDRPEAIKYALSTAQKGDSVLIAGKGRDNYMAIGKEYIPYSDYDEIEKLFEYKKI